MRLAVLPLAAAAALLAGLNPVAAAQQNCSDPICIDAIDGSACYAEGMGGSLANVLKCITKPTDVAATVLKNLCACYTCIGGTAATTVQNSGQCPK